MIHQDLLDYIEKQLQKGVSQEQLKANLLASGWQENSITEAFASLSTNSAPQEAQPNPQKIQSAAPYEQTPTTSTPVEYFAIPLSHLVFFSIITLDLYIVYWFYKNWQAIKKSGDKKADPLGYAIFSIFTCNGLFKNILRSANNYSYPNPYSPGWLATAFITLWLLGGILSPIALGNLTLDLITLILAIFTFLPLIPVQKAINFNNEKIKGVSDLNRGFSTGEIILIIIGLILFILNLIGIFLPA